jgi:hypothetical protein
VGSPPSVPASAGTWASSGGGATRFPDVKKHPCIVDTEASPIVATSSFLPRSARRSLIPAPAEAAEAAA